MDQPNFKTRRLIGGLTWGRTGGSSRRATAGERFGSLVRQATRGLAILLGALMLLWSAAVNGRPSVFPDTSLYYAQAEYLASAMGLVRTPRLPPGDPTALPDRPGAPNVSVTIDRARSPLYGLFVYGLERLGSLWLVAAVQAMLVALSLSILFHAAAPRAGEGWYLGWMAALAALTSLPFFTSFIMPDVFAGATGAVALAVMIYWDRLGSWRRISAVVVLVFSVAAHRSNLLLALALAGSGGALLTAFGVGRRVAILRAGVVIGAIAASWGLSALAIHLIDAKAGEPIRDPPFLMARIVADGPGRRYLIYACAHGEPFALCRYRSLPPEDSDTLLWSNLPRNGMFGVSDYQTRLRIEAEEPAFVLGALAYDPVGELKAAALNVANQLGVSHVQSPLRDPSWLVTDAYWRRTSFPRIIVGADQCVEPGQCASRLSPVVVNRIQDSMLVCALTAVGMELLWLVSRPGVLADLRRLGGDMDDRKRLLGMIILTAVLLLVNAIVCGALSAPVSRYQARLIWLIPAVAMLGGLALAPTPGAQTGRHRAKTRVPKQSQRVNAEVQTP